MWHRIRAFSCGVWRAAQTVSENPMYLTRPQIVFENKSVINYLWRSVVFFSGWFHQEETDSTTRFTLPSNHSHLLLFKLKCSNIGLQCGRSVEINRMWQGHNLSRKQIKEWQPVISLLFKIGVTCHDNRLHQKKAYNYTVSKFLF